MRYRPIALLLVALASPALAGDAPSPGGGVSLVEDASISFTVRAALLEKLADRALGVYIVTEAGCVQLSGSVPDASSRDTAAKVAGKVPGVHRVDNFIDLADELHPQSGGTGLTPSRHPSEVPDALLEARVKTSLLRQFGAHSFRLAVAADRGVVNLAGAIPSVKEREQAVASVRRVPGVRGVQDEMRVDRALRKTLDVD